MFLRFTLVCSVLKMKRVTFAVRLQRQSKEFYYITACDGKIVFDLFLKQICHFKLIQNYIYKFSALQILKVKSKVYIIYRSETDTYQSIFYSTA